MTKITEPDYFLPNILATAYLNTFDKGATSPLQIRGFCQTDMQENDYVLKLRAGEGMSNDNLTKELLGAFIGAELGLDVIEPVIINVTQKFIDEIPAGYTKEKTLAQNSLGINYGTKYVKYNQVIKDMKLSPVQRKNAAKVFLFDIIINNVDRRYEEKHNMFSSGEKFYIYDHEKAFSFIEMNIKLPFLKAADSWLIKDIDLNWITKHFFYKYFKGNIIEHLEFFENFAGLDANFWAKAKSLIPEEWDCEQYFEGIKEHIAQINLNIVKYQEELVRILV